MATSSLPQGSNTYLPSTEATNNLIVDFSRNAKDFSLNKYIQIVPVSKMVGRYIEMTVEQAGRILNTSLQDHIWADGEDAPSGRGNMEKFAFKPFTTTRYLYDFRVGELAVEQAEWDILAQHARIYAQQAMTARTQLAITLMTTSGNYPSANTSAVSSISGNTGKWDVSTSARLDIKRSLRYAQDVIRKATLGAVKPGDMMLVMSPGCAGKLSETQEIVDLIKQSPTAIDYVKNGLGPNASYGLPDKLYGVDIVVEDAVKVTSRKGATKATSYVLSDSTPFLCSRPGGLEGGKDSNESPRFSTATMFAYEDMTVESKHDTDNRVHKGRIVDNIGFVMTAGVAGFLFTAAVD